MGIQMILIIKYINTVGITLYTADITYNKSITFRLQNDLPKYHTTDFRQA